VRGQTELTKAMKHDPWAFSENIVLTERKVRISWLSGRTNSRQWGGHTAWWDRNSNILRRTWDHILWKARDFDALCLILIAGGNDLLFCQLDEDHCLSYDTDLNDLIAGELEFRNGHRVTRHKVAIQDSEDGFMSDD
jgi:hypothetical protein